MSLKDTEADTDVVALDISYELYLKHRDDPVRVLATFEIERANFTSGSELETLIEFAFNHVRTVVDLREQHRFIVSDRMLNKSVFMADQIQGYSILAPERATVLKALEE